MQKYIGVKLIEAEPMTAYQEDILAEDWGIVK